MCIVTYIVIVFVCWVGFLCCVGVFDMYACVVLEGCLIFFVLSWLCECFFVAYCVLGVRYIDMLHWRRISGKYFYALRVCRGSI